MTARPTILISVLALSLLLAGCGEGVSATTQPPTTAAPETATTAPTETASPTASDTPSPTATATASPSPTASQTATAAASPTASATPTPEKLTATAQGSANCRYGPSASYLYAWGLSDGDTAEVQGKNDNGTWLWVTPHDTSWNCWVSADAMMLDGDIASVQRVFPQLLTHPEVDSANGVSAVRNGDKVTVSWSAASPAVGLGYLIEARICLGSYQWDVYYSTTNTSYTITDPQTCGANSYGQLRVFNKLGYSNAVTIPWP